MIDIKELTPGTKVMIEELVLDDSILLVIQETDYDLIVNGTDDRIFVRIDKDRPNLAPWEREFDISIKDIKKVFTKKEYPEYYI